MRILEIIPFTVDEGLINYEREFLPADVDVVALKEGLLCECPSDVARNLPGILDAIKDAERQGYDAVVIAGFIGPGVEEGRELVDIPVLAPLNVSLNVSMMIGHRTCVLIPEYARMHFFLKQLVGAYGLQDRVVVRGTNTKLPQALQAYEEYKTRGAINAFITEVIDICVKSIEEDDVDVFVFGTGAIKWMKEVLEGELGRRGYHITVMNPLTIAIEMARTLVNLKLAHNRRAYPKPPPAHERYAAKP